jgi:hypothetical protein
MSSERISKSKQFLNILAFWNKRESEAISSKRKNDKTDLSEKRQRVAGEYSFPLEEHNQPNDTEYITSTLWSVHLE